MKLLIAAAAVVIAAPAAAQTAPAHAAHSEHGDEHKGEHKSCCEHKNADGSLMDCCKTGQDGKPAACCDKHAGSGEKHGASHH